MLVRKILSDPAPEGTGAVMRAAGLRGSGHGSAGADCYKRNGSVMEKSRRRPGITHIRDIPEADPSHFIVKEKGKTLAEGSLVRIKLSIDEPLLYRAIKRMTKDPRTMVTTIDF